MSITPVGSGSAKPLDIAFLVANAIGIVLYLKLASRGWRNPLEQGMIPVTGEPIVWALALPVLAAFFLTDVVWGVLLLRHKEWRGRLWWVLSAVSWLIAIGVDFSHH